MMEQATKVRFPDFSQRLEHACDKSRDVPPANYGRLRWIAEQLMARFGTKVTVETVRKWLAGEARPRTEKLTQLATILQVEPEYLLLGRSSGLTEEDRQSQTAKASGIVNVLAGFVAMDGGRPAFPQEDDGQAKEGLIDLYAVIKGARYAFRVVSGKKETNGWEFTVPVNALDDAVVIIGAVRSSGFSCEFLELDPDAVRAEGHRHGEVYQVKVPARLRGTPWKRIETFAERLL